MAGYRIFYKPTNQEIVDTLAEIGITLKPTDHGNYAVTFSDNSSASFYVPSPTRIANCWIFADDDSHTFIVFNPSDYSPEDGYITPQDTTTSYNLIVFIAEKEDGTLYSNNGFDGASNATSHQLCSIINVPELSTKRLSNNDPALTELKLIPVAGNFYFANTDDSPLLYEYYIFKHAYVNYHRWFPLGTVIRGANGETFMGWGWILFRLGANS